MNHDRYMEIISGSNLPRHLPVPDPSNASRVVSGIDDVMIALDVPR